MAIREIDCCFLKKESYKNFENLETETLNELYKSLSMKIKNPPYKSAKYISQLVNTLGSLNYILDKKVFKNKANLN